MSELPRVLTYFLQGGIKYSTKGKPLDGTLNKLNRSCAILEFLANQNNLLGRTRTALIAGMLYDFKLNNVSLDTAATVKELFTKQYFKLHTAQFILMQKQGWGYVDSLEHVKGFETIVSDLIKALLKDKWISTKDLIEYTECRSLKIKPVSDSASAYRLYYDKTIEKGNTDYVSDS